MNEYIQEPLPTPRIATVSEVMQVLSDGGSDIDGVSRLQWVKRAYLYTDFFNDLGIERAKLIIKFIADHYYKQELADLVKYLEDWIEEELEN